MAEKSKQNSGKTAVPQPRNFTAPKTSDNPTSREELEFYGIGVSKGIAYGTVVRLHGRSQIFKILIGEENVETEIRRFRAAVRLTRQRLRKVKEIAFENFGEEQSYIFESHILMLEDRSFHEQTESYIRTHKVNSAWAVKSAGDNILALYAKIEDDYLRERRADVEDVIQRLLFALSGTEPTTGIIAEDAVLVAREILPSTVAELNRRHAQAIITEHGGWTSHGFILARELNLPAVSGVKNIFQKAKSGDSVIVDGFRGRVFLNPAATTLERYLPAITRFRETYLTNDKTDAIPLITPDGIAVTLRANLDLPEKYAEFKEYGANGIGLFRSEFLIGKDGKFPSENEQIEVYARLARLAGNGGTKIRLFDCGADAMPQAGYAREPNPALGLRAIRLGLAQEIILRPQIRAIVRVAATENIEMTLPMISDIREVRKVREIIAEERNFLDDRNIAHGPVKIGVMIEVPAAALIAEQLAREVDFFSLGTNDLVQYLLAVDRDNEQVADWFRTLHPAVLFCIKKTLEAAKQAGIPAFICGEMASSPVYATVLLGLGATEFSMTATAIPRVRQVLQKIRQSEAAEIVAQMLIAGLPDETEEIVRREFTERFGALFPPEMLPQIHPAGKSSKQK